MARYRTIGTDLNRQYRNDLNWNFEQIEKDIDGNKAEIERVETETLQKVEDIVGGGFIESLENARDNANSAATNANDKASYANTQGNYAKTQGDYAKEQGDYAKNKGDYADEKAQLADQAAANANKEAGNLSQLKIDVVTATQNANTATDNANKATTNAETATQNAITATTNAEQATQDAQTATDAINQILPNVEGLEPKGEYNPDTEYTKNNIVSYMGSSFMSLVDGNIGNTPTASQDYWLLLARKGTDGTGSVSSVNGVGPDESGNVDIGIEEIEGLSQALENAGKVKTVNNIEPDENGNIEIETATSWNDLNDKPTSFPSTIPEVDGLQVVLNEKANNTDLASLEQTVNEHLAESASLTQAGHVQLSNLINSTREDLAVTPNAIRKLDLKISTRVDNNILPSNTSDDFEEGVTITVPIMNATNVVYTSWKEVVNDAMGLDIGTALPFFFVIETHKRLIFSIQIFYVFSNYISSSGTLLYTLTRMSNAQSSTFSAWRVMRIISFSGEGSPEGSIHSPYGTMYLDTLNNNLYFKKGSKSGSFNTGWELIGGG